MRFQQVWHINNNSDALSSTVIRFHVKYVVWSTLIGLHVNSHALLIPLLGPHLLSRILINSHTLSPSLMCLHELSNKRSSILMGSNTSYVLSSILPLPPTRSQRLSSPQRSTWLSPAFLDSHTLSSLSVNLCVICQSSCAIMVECCELCNRFFSSFPIKKGSDKTSCPMLELKAVVFSNLATRNGSKHGITRENWGIERERQLDWVHRTTRALFCGEWNYGQQPEARGIAKRMPIENFTS